MAPPQRKKRRRRPRVRAAAGPTRREDLRDEQHRWKLSLLRSYVARHGWHGFQAKHLVVPPGVKLGGWVTRQRSAFAAGKLAPWLRDELETIPGWRWRGRLGLDSRTSRKLTLLRRAMAARGWQALPNPIPPIEAGGVDLRNWLIGLRGRYHYGDLPPSMESVLEDIPGWAWSEGDAVDRHKLELLKGLVGRRAARPEIDLGRVVQLGNWILSRRSDRASGRLAKELEVDLESIPGWRWSQDEP